MYGIGRIVENITIEGKQIPRGSRIGILAHHGEFCIVDFGNNMQLIMPSELIDVEARTDEEIKRCKQIGKTEAVEKEDKKEEKRINKNDFLERIINSEKVIFNNTVVNFETAVQEVKKVEEEILLVDPDEGIYRGGQNTIKLD